MWRSFWSILISTERGAKIMINIDTNSHKKDLWPFSPVRNEIMSEATRMRNYQTVTFIVRGQADDRRIVWWFFGRINPWDDALKIGVIVLLQTSKKCQGSLKKVNGGNSPEVIISQNRIMWLPFDLLWKELSFQKCPDAPYGSSIGGCLIIQRQVCTVFDYAEKADVSNESSTER